MGQHDATLQCVRTLSRNGCHVEKKCGAVKGGKFESDTFFLFPFDSTNMFSLTTFIASPVAVNP